jgi:hypothetical protein
MFGAHEEGGPIGAHAPPIKKLPIAMDNSKSTKPTIEN